jgi:hypothetical protein
MTHSAPRWSGLRGWAGALCTCCTLLTPAAWANDGPYLRLDTALVEDDDERSFEVNSRLSQTKSQRELGVQLEYNFAPTLSAEVELGWSRERGGPERERELELSLRHVWIDPNRQGWGLGGRFSLGWDKSTEADRPAWAWAGPTAVAVFTLPLRNPQGELNANLHANLGLSRNASAANTRAVWALGADAPVTRKVSLFAEAAGRATEDRVLHSGVRWWLQREKVALDVSVSRTETLATGDAARGIHIGLNLFDLNF